ncbi:restriction endonuclease subunit S, partial [bacterium]|nr:restriction endonuclease subunit S [bacterium]
MDDFDVRSIGSLFEYTIPGEWGGDATPESGVPVLRATNFTDSGAIDYTDIVYREIPPSRLLSRRVTKGTILIEKSGGGPSKPAGRVVFCDSHFSGCASNFVEIAKVKKGFDANFVFYLLYYLYQIGLVVKYQQQTTGIINFKLDQYKDEKVSIPRSTAEQTEIAAI